VRPRVSAYLRRARRCAIIRLMQREPNIWWLSIKHYVRARVRQPPKVRRGTSLKTMPVGKGGYLDEVVVDAEGQPFARPYKNVLPYQGFDAVLPEGDPRRNEPPVTYDFVERISEDEYDLTIEQEHVFQASSEQATADAVRFRSLFEAPNLLHPHHRRLRLEQLPMEPAA
jgi:hypothetical protein